MADNKFIDLIFEPENRHPSIYRSAYQSLAKNPQQLFALVLKKDISTQFFSAFALHGKQVAALLSNTPTYFGPASDDSLHLGKDELQLYEETLGSFLFTFFPMNFPDIASQESLAQIFMAVIKLSRVGNRLELLGAELGQVPSILNRLIVDGRIAIWSRRNPQEFRSLTSNNWMAWATVAIHLAKQCIPHRERLPSEGIKNWNDTAKLLQSFPCGMCPPPSSDVTTEHLARRANTQVINTGTRAYDNLLGEHLGPWKIVISALALKDFRAAVTQGHFGHIRERLLALASGEWMRSSLRGDTPDPSNTGYRVPVYTVSCRGKVILWQVDIAFDERHYCTMQVVKVWSICSAAEVQDMCEWIIQAQRTYTNARVVACQTIDLRRLKGSAFPVSISSDLGDTDDSSTDTTSDGPMPPSTEDGEMTENCPILGKFFSLTSTVLDSLRQNVSTAVFPVDPSGEEINVINHFKSPAFILGRSGTGKTTCLIYKLASRYLTSKVEGEVPVRQLLLTRSKDLAQKLKLYTRRLINTRLGITDEDVSVGQDQSITWNESEEDTTEDLLSLNDADFPLVCTFNNFLMRLENTIRFNDIRNATRLKPLTKRLNPVDFTTFRVEYWRKFPAALTRKIPVDLAFVDIMGVIKGSASLSTNLQPLSRDDYTGKRWKLAPNFAHGKERESLYTLYECYENIKRSRGELDDTDRVVLVLKALSKNLALRQEVEGLLHEVYVDEVQDQRSLEIELLLSLIPDPRGIHFAGDTAQSISKDSLFRFPNAKALFYSRFSDPSTTAKQAGLVPKLLPLSRNYRSHRGILSLASVIMDLLYAGFPELVDELPPEIGDHIGPEPTLYIGSNLVSALQGAAEASAEEDAEHNAFGGERVILVRDDQSQQELQSKVKDSALVLTILQSKGMEFEDVFLYDFFTTTPYSSDFQILEDLLEKYHSSDIDKCARKEIDIVLCSELKHLYVAVTRARAHLWVVESDGDGIHSVINLFNKVVPRMLNRRYPKPLLKVIRDCEFPDISDLRKQFHSTGETSPARWIELAFELMDKKIYEQAGMCFKRAGDKTGEALADAYFVELKGIEHRAAGSKKDFIAAFEKASKLFVKAGRIEKAVQCQEALGNILAAAVILSKNGRHEEAAALFTEAGEPKKAAREYGEMVAHEKVLATCYHSGLYNELIVYLESFASKINPNCRKQYARLSYLLLLKNKCEPQFHKKIQPCLGSVAEQESVCREFEMLNHVFDIQRTSGRFQEACELAANIGYLEEALSLAKINGAILPESFSENVVNYVHAGRLLAVKHGSEKNRQTHKMDNSTEVNQGMLPAEERWKSLTTFLNKYAEKGEIPNSSIITDGLLRDFFILLVTMKIPQNPSALSADLTKTPLEFIQRAIQILNTIHIQKTILPSVLLFLGIYATPLNSGYIALPWSPLGINPKLQFPIQYIKLTDGVREAVVRFILLGIIAALRSLEQHCSQQWRKNTKNKVVQGSYRNIEWTSDRFSAHLQAVLSLNLIFANIEIICTRQRLTDPVMSSWEFWQHALIQQMTFTSSYEQDASVITALRSKLVSPAPEPQQLYSKLQQCSISVVGKFKLHPGLVTYDILSTLLQQMQTAELFDVEARWWPAIQSRVTHNSGLPNLTEAYEILTLFRDVRAHTTVDDFPINFSESIHKLLSKLENIQSTKKSHRLFYSASILSFYEELVTLTLLLSRPISFVIPLSWTNLHLPKLVKIPRYTSKREIVWYQSILIRIIIGICALVSRIEDGVSGNRATADSLARRSVNILVIGIINMGTLTPLPADYSRMWSQVQKVFHINSLKTEPIRKVPAERLLQHLGNSFARYSGKDKLRVIMTNGYNVPNNFAAFPVPESAVLYPGIPKPREHRREVVDPEPNLRKDRMNAVYTHFYAVLLYRGSRNAPPTEPKHRARKAEPSKGGTPARVNTTVSGGGRVRKAKGLK